MSDDKQRCLARCAMECKLLEKQDIELMKYFVDDENTKYDEVILNAFAYK